MSDERPTFDGLGPAELDGSLRAYEDRRFIPREALEERGVYRLRARNLRFGVWDGEGFVGLRDKFGLRLDECEVPYSTAFPLKLVAKLPGDYEAAAYTGTVCRSCGKPARWTGPPAPAPWECDGGCPADQVLAMAVSNTNLFDFLRGLEAGLGVER